jgi:hypothetical protein
VTTRRATPAVTPISTLIAFPDLRAAFARAELEDGPGFVEPVASRPRSDRGKRPTLRPLPVEGDNMEPTIRRGDIVFVSPTDQVDGEGIYVTQAAVGGPAIYRIQPIGGGEVRLSSDNPIYGVHDLPVAVVNRMVLAKVAAKLTIMSRHLVPDEWLF